MGRPRDNALIKIPLAQTRGSQRFDQEKRKQRQRRLLLGWFVSSLLNTKQVVLFY